MADTETDAQQPDLDEATTPRPIDELRVLHNTTTTLRARVIGPKGVAMEVEIVGVKHDGLEGAALRAIAFEKALIQYGLKPAPQPSPVAAQANPPSQQQAGGAATGAGAVEIPGENGGPPRCSVHGAMKWFEGNQGRAWWSCSGKGPDGKYCRPKKAGA